MEAIKKFFADLGLIQFFGNLALRNILPCIIILVGGYFIVKILTRLFGKGLSRSHLDKNIHAFLKTTFKILLYILLLLIAASSLGIDVTSLIAVFSVASLALSLAVQDSLANIASGIVLLASHPFSVGDFVEVGGHSGTVEKVGLAYTCLRTPDNKIVYVPNKDVANSRISNYSAEEKRRVDLNFSAAYTSDPEAVISALKEAANLPLLIKGEEIFAKISEYKDSSIQYTVRVWVKTEDYWTAYFTIIENVKKVFDDKGVIMTYPHTIVHLEK